MGRFGSRGVERASGSGRGFRRAGNVPEDGAHDLHAPSFVRWPRRSSSSSRLFERERYVRLRRWLFRTCESFVTGRVHPTEQREHTLLDHNREGDLVKRRMELRGTEPLDRFHETPGAQGNSPTASSVDGWIVADEYTLDEFGQVT